MRISPLRSTTRIVCVLSAVLNRSGCSDCVFHVMHALRNAPPATTATTRTRPVYFLNSVIPHLLDC